MFGGYRADKIARSVDGRPLRVLVLEAGPFLLPTHVQNLPRPGLNVPPAVLPSSDTGVPQQRRIRGTGVLCRRQVALLGRLVPAVIARALNRRAPA
jgi:hypothetical protein